MLSLIDYKRVIIKRIDVYKISRKQGIGRSIIQKAIKKLGLEIEVLDEKCDGIRRYKLGTTSLRRGCLFYYYQLPLAKIAERLNLPEGTVKSRLSEHVKILESITLILKMKKEMNWWKTISLKKVRIFYLDALISTIGM